MSWSESWSWLSSNFCCCLGREKKKKVDVSGSLPEGETGGGSDFGYALAKHDRQKMEDGICVHEDVAGWRLFAVFDGHAGKQAVLAAQSLLPETLAASLNANSDVKACLQAAFEEIDARICQVLLDSQDAGPDEISSGTVVCLALVKGRDVWIANLGDCRAIACKGDMATAISEDHSPEKNEKEASRLKQAGVDVSGGYVGNHVAVSRAWGNVHYSTKQKVTGILCEPEMYHRTIGDDVDFVVVASDGVWDCLKEQFAFSHARKALRGSQKPEDAAIAVLESAGKISKADNAAVIVIVFNFPKPLPTRNPGQRVSLAQLEAAAKEETHS